MKQGKIKYFLIAAIALLVVGIVCRIIYVNTAPEQEAVEPAEIVVVEEKDETVPNEGEVVLSDHQRELISGYGNDELKIINLLSSNVWTAGAENKMLKFSEDAYVLTDGGKSEDAVPFAISAVKSSTMSGDGEVIIQYDAAIETADGIHLFMMQQSQADPSRISISCDAFQPTSWVRCDPATTFDVTDIPNGITQLIDGKDDEMVEAVKGFCSVSYPTVSGATCEPSATVDFADNTIEFNVMLSNINKTMLTVTYDKSAQTFQVN